VPVVVNNNTPTAPKLTAGDTAPEIELPDLEGKTVRLSDFNDRETLILFWNPGCGYCQRMLPELKDWISSRQPGAPELLVVSRGQEAENRAQGIEAPILLDQGFSTGRSYGATGTPTAVLIGAGGMVASPVVAGAPAVMTLARGGSSNGSNGNAPANTVKLG
jgi:peroxiredoxin